LKIKKLGSIFAGGIFCAAAEKIEKLNLKNLQKIGTKFLEISTIEKMENFSIAILCDFFAVF